MTQFCNKCGNRLIEGDAFCEVCGTPVAQQAGQQQQQQQPYSCHQPDTRVVEQPQYGYQQPQQYPNNMYSPQSQSQPQPQPQPKKKNSALLIVIIIIAAVAILAGGGFLIYRFLAGGTGNELKNQIESQADTYSIYEASDPNHEAAESDNEMSASDYGMPGSDYETVYSDYESINPDNNTDIQTPNALEDPTQEDFDWITGVTAPPFGAQILTASADISGQWKAYLDYSQVGAEEYAVVNIIADGKTAKVEWSIRQIDFDGTGFRKGPDKLYYLDGVFDEGYLNATGEIRGDFTVTSFYKLGSKQYALGAMINPSGDTAYVYLVR